MSCRGAGGGGGASHYGRNARWFSEKVWLRTIAWCTEHEELAALVPDVVDAGREARRLHIIFTNGYGNYGTTNAVEIWEELKLQGRPAAAR